MSPAYPETRIENVPDRLANVSFPDPYHWLEADSDEVRQWQRAQGELAAGQVREWPHFEALRELVARLTVERFASVPRYAGGRWFWTRTPDGATQAQAVTAGEPYGPERVLFDPYERHPEQPPFLSWLSPSPDGRILAVGVCADGSENNTIRLIDVGTGAELPDPPPQVLMDNWTGGAQWLPDSSGFFFSAISGKPTDFTQRVYLHRRGPVPSTQVADVPWTLDTDYRAVFVSDDGRWAVATERLMNPIPVAIAALGDDELSWRPFVTAVEGTVAGHVAGDRFVALTDVDAPRGRVVAIDLDAADPNDSTTWHDLIPASDAVLRSVTPVAEVLYVTEFVDTYARVRVVDRSGAAVGEVPLPGRGAVAELPFPFMNLARADHPTEYLFAYSSLVESWGVYRHRPGGSVVETLSPPRVRLSDAVVDDAWATSADGTRIPYHVVRRAEVPAELPQPAMIYAYGGFNAPWVPQFPGAMAAFVEAGGLFVHAHLRGGGEYGRQWWEEGRHHAKQNCYADLYAVAEQLISDGTTSADQLALTGGSNGGLLAGVATTQRPELWRVVVPRVPLLDLIGACRDKYGRMAVSMEFADPDDPDDVRRLAGFSPYHLIDDGRRYPAVFLDAGDTDPRCPPWHARKFGARLQAAQGGDAPILIRIWENVGHGWATDKDIAITETTEWLAFIMRQLNLTPKE